MPARHFLRQRRITLAIVVAAATIGVTLGVFVAPGHSVGPMGSLSFTGLTKGDPVASAALPADVESLLNFIAPMAQEDSTALGQNVYLVRQSLGPKGLDVYAFETDAGDPCFVVPSEGATCGFNAHGDTPGFYYRIGGGNGGSEPSYLFAIVSDNVQSVDLTVDGKDVPVSISNNVAYASYPNTARLAAMTVHYANGGTSSTSAALTPAGTSVDPPAGVPEGPPSPPGGH